MTLFDLRARTLHLLLTGIARRDPTAADARSERFGRRPCSHVDRGVLAPLSRGGQAPLTERCRCRTNARVESPEERIEQLSRSRRRLLAAADAERQRIERALHDGTQQHLIALCVNLQLAMELVRTDPPAAETLLETMRSDTHEALHALHALVHDVYPPLLSERGAIEALRTAAADIEARVRVDASLVGPQQPEVEAALYFCCIDALRRIAGRGIEARASVRAWQEEGSLLFEVTEESDGDTDWCEATVTAVGDRVVALGGHLTIDSPAIGSRLSGRIPLEPEAATPPPPGT
jgi:signal transduction histidine kinase